MYFFLEKTNIKLITNAFSILRHEERMKYSINGSTWVLISLVVSYLLDFSKENQIVAFLILAISDTLAAVVGKKYGTKKILDKTIEGGLAFFLSCFLILFIYKYNFTTFQDANILLIKIFAISSALTLIEFFAKKIKINDNFLIPMSFHLIYNIFFKF